MNNKEDSDCDDDIPLLCFDKSKQVVNINPTEEIKKLLNILDPMLFETKFSLIHQHYAVSMLTLERGPASTRNIPDLANSTVANVIITSDIFRLASTTIVTPERVARHYRRELFIPSASPALL
ncbi:hypothetical protein QE152_g5598 [Popillia japonica]|uniref:Uncharacterized protein n=1 Tax=Popillia japonica TaxID=7064 RepID=A0AAW1MM85_POPJA